MRKAQYSTKNPRLMPIPTAGPLRPMAPNGTPISTNTIHAAGIENFLWISTSYRKIACR